MNCRRFQNQIADYVAGWLDAVESKKMSDHAKTCPACAQSMKEEFALRALFANASEPTASPNIMPRLAAHIATHPRRAPVFRGWVWGSGLVTAAAALTIFFMPAANKTPLVVKQPRPAIAVAKTEQPYAAMLNDMSAIGQEESEMLLHETRPTEPIVTAQIREGEQDE